VAPWLTRALTRSGRLLTSLGRSSGAGTAGDELYSQGSSFSDSDGTAGSTTSRWAAHSAASLAGGGGGGGGGHPVPFAAAPPLVKLDVIRAGQIRTLLRFIWAGIAVSVGVCVAVLVAASRGLIDTAFGPDGKRPVPLSWTPELLQWQNLLWIIVLSISCAWTTTLMVLFGVRIARLPSSRRTAEQVWVFTLLFCTAVAFCPPFLTRLVLERLHNGPEDLMLLYAMNGTIGELITGAYTCCHLFYLWSCCVQYRRQATPVTAAVRAGVLAAMWGIKVFLALRVRLVMTHLPLVSAVLASIVYIKADVEAVPVAHAVLLATMTAIEAVLVWVIASDFVATHRYLAAQDPMAFRTKRVGFRFFVFHNLLHRISYLGLYVAFFVGLSLQPALKCLVDKGETGAYDRDQSYLFLSVVAYVSVEAFVNLPADSVGIRGWWTGGRHGCDAPACTMRAHPTDKGGAVAVNMEADVTDSFSEGTRDSVDSGTPSEQSDSSRQRDETAGGKSPPTTCTCAPAAFSYAAREPAGRHAIAALHPRTFVMERQVKLFNYAWLAYSHGRNSHPFDVDAQLAADGFAVLDEVTSDETDTMALVVASADRVVVTFRGTTTALNVKTNLAVVQVSAASLFPSLAFGSGSGESLPPSPSTHAEMMAAASMSPTLRSGRLFPVESPRRGSFSALSGLPRGRARLHTGFANAYASVRQRLLSTLHTHLIAHPHKEVFFTGHSLGGALATLAAYDLRTSPFPDNGPFLPRGRVAVATFGAPKAGNAAWTAAYDAAVPHHWRVAVAGDIVCGLPHGLGLCHVGQQALLTSSGQLVLDPSSLEAHLGGGGGAPPPWAPPRKRPPAGGRGGGGGRPGGRRRRTPRGRRRRRARGGGAVRVCAV